MTSSKVAKLESSVAMVMFKVSGLQVMVTRTALSSMSRVPVACVSSQLPIDRLPR